MGSADNVVALDPVTGSKMFETVLEAVPFTLRRYQIIH